MAVLDNEDGQCCDIRIGELIVSYVGIRGLLQANANKEIACIVRELLGT